MAFTFRAATRSPVYMEIAGEDGKELRLHVPPMRVRDWVAIGAEEHARRTNDAVGKLAPTDRARFLAAFPISELDIKDLTRYAYTTTGTRRVLELCLARCPENPGTTEPDKTAWGVATARTVLDAIPSLDDLEMLVTALAASFLPKPDPAAAAGTGQQQQADADATFATEGKGTAPDGVPATFATEGKPTGSDPLTRPEIASGGSGTTG